MAEIKKIICRIFHHCFKEIPVDFEQLRVHISFLQSHDLIVDTAHVTTKLCERCNLHIVERIDVSGLLAK